MEEKIIEREIDGNSWFVTWPEIQQLGGDPAETGGPVVPQEKMSDANNGIEVANKDEAIKSAVTGKGKTKPKIIKIENVIIIKL